LFPFRTKGQRFGAKDGTTIIDRGRGAELAGTRITVYDVLDCHELGWHRDVIAEILELSFDLVHTSSASE
jgi:hypothetical protein